MPVMLKGNSFDYYAENAHKFSTYEESKELLEGWYNNAEKKSRVLMEWQRVIFTT